MHCRSERTNLCLAIREQQNKGYLPDGTTRLGRNGEPIRHFMGTSTFAEYTVMPEIALAKVNPEAPLDHACLFACGLSTGLGAAMNTAKVEAGSTCVVFGAGMVGLGAVAGCRLRGAERIVAVDLSPERLELARAHGATDTLAGGPDVVDEIVAMTDGFGADYTFEATGNVNVMRQAVEAARMGWGLCTVAGVAGKGETLDIVPRFLITGRRVAGSSFGGVKGRDQVPELVERGLAGDIDVASFVSHRITLDDVNHGVRADGGAGRHPERDRVRMIVERVEHPQWLSNAYLVAEGAGGHGFFIDGNGLTDELERRAEQDGITITHVLCTHGHGDHVVGVEELAARHGVPLLAHAATHVRADERLADGDTIESGGLERARAVHARPLRRPSRVPRRRHALLHGRRPLPRNRRRHGRARRRPRQAQALDPRRPARARSRDAGLPGAPRGDDDRRRAALEPVHPRVARRRRPRRASRAVVNGEEATLLLWADDYDGGHKALVRLASGEETIVGGSRVERMS